MRAPTAVITSFLLSITAVVVAQSPGTASHQAPAFQVDPSWPRTPSNLVIAEFGEVQALVVDPQDNLWVLHRRADLTPEQQRQAIPPVVEFDAQGNLLRAWGGPGKGYEWPLIEHGLTMDDDGYVWVSGEGPSDDQILKFTKDGKFVLQIGHSKQSTGSRDVKNVHGAADIAVSSKSKEVFVADYLNGRIIVFSSETGAFKRMWGAFGNPPADHPMLQDRVAWKPENASGYGISQFSRVHCIKISNDGLVYAADKGNMRIQVFTPDGKYQSQVFVSREAIPLSTLPGTAFGIAIKDFADAAANLAASVQRIAFSPDPDQRFMYVTDRRTGHVLIFERKTLQLIGSFGGQGVEPGRFLTLHDIATDLEGNIYTGENEVPGNKRIQKFLYKGLTNTAGK